MAVAKKAVTFSKEQALELLSCYGSPLYVYDKEVLLRSIENISAAVTYPNRSFHFAAVTNGNLAILKIFQSVGWGLHANTPGDVFLGLHAGFNPANIVYSGSNLTDAEIVKMLEWSVGTFNLDSIAQVEAFCEVLAKSRVKSPPKLGLRISLPNITRGSRIGVRIEEFAEAIKIADSVGLKVTGIHFYRGTGTNATEAFTRVIGELLDACSLLPDWEFLDFGGGFGYNYRTNRLTFDWSEFGHFLTTKLSKFNKPIQLLIEPGRAVVAGCGTLLVTVVSVKWRDGKQVVGVDSTVSNLSVISVHGGYREILSFSEDQELYQTDVCGNTTFSRDYLGRDMPLSRVKKGDILAIIDSGAYGFAMSSHFLHRVRPAEVLLENGSSRLIREREDYNTLLQKQSLE